MHRTPSLARSLAVILIAVAAAIAIAAGPARADVIEDGWVAPDGLRHGSGAGLLLHHVWQGQGSDPESEHWAGALVPSTVASSLPDSLATDLWCIESGVLADPAARYTWSTQRNARASYLLWLADHGWDSPHERAAIHYLLYADAYPTRGWNTDEHGMAALILAHDEFTHAARDSVARFRALSSWSNAPAALETIATGVPSTGELAGVGVTDAWGEPVSGLAFSATISGPAVFDDTGTASLTGVTGQTLSSLAWTATDAGELSFSVTYRDAAPGGLTVGSSIAQDYVGGTGFDDLRASAGPVATRIDFQPGGTSLVEEPVIAPGGALRDAFVTGAIDGTRWQRDGDGAHVPVTYSVDVYALGETPPASPSVSPPDGATPVATQRIVATGPGVELEADLGPAPEPGFYTFVWSVARADQPGAVRDYIRADWSDGFGLPHETASARHHVEVATQAGTRATSQGQFLVDEVFLAGFPADHGRWRGNEVFAPDADTVTLTLLFFASGATVSDDNLDEATTVGSVELPAADGHYPAVGSPQFRVETDADGAPIPGTYVFVTAFAGDDRVAPFTTSVEDEYEQVEIGTQSNVPDAPATPTSTPGPEAPAALAETGTDWTAVLWITGTVLALTGIVLLRRTRRRV